ncbi:MAG: ABC transporter substrate-binding protein [Deltaproteobacteria bacterium]|nr:MAG: ABC transporter substrate-binding protein [Deltaproteobacteria bacterium]
MDNKNLVTMVAAGLLLFTAIMPVQGAERGVSDTEIKIGQWGPQTGPAALWGAVARGSGCYFDMINAEGGIHGRKITYFLRDDAYQPPKTKAIAKELVEDKKVFAFASGVGTATGMAVKKYLHKNRVPWVGPASGSTYWAYPPTKYLFAVYPLYCDEAAILINYAVEKMGKKRIAFFYQNDDYGKEGLYGAELALEKYGMKLVAAVSAEPLDTDLSSHCVKLKDANPDCVLMWVLPKHGAIILGTAAKMGLKPQWMASSTLSDTPIMYKISKGLFKDVMVTSFGEVPESRHLLMKKYKEAHDKFAPKDRWGIFFYAGFLFAEPMVEALKRCGRDLTADNFVKAMETIKDFQGIGPKITYGPNERQGSRSFFIAKCLEGGELARISDWMTSDIDLQGVIKRR